MIIRPYQPTDNAACATLFNSNTPGFFDPAERAGFNVWLTAHDQSRLAYPTNRAEHFFVLEKDTEVRACGGFCILPAGIANMAWGMVARAYHKQGLGKRLLDYRLQHIAANYRECSVILDTTQHTFGFFEKQGFSVTGIIKNYYGPNLDRYDMVLNSCL